MNITLETVRNVLREALGYQSFTASFISNVIEDEAVDTAGITKDGELRYNKAWVDKHVGSKEDLFCLIFHELLHPAFQHFIFGNGKLENIAADAIINACISGIYTKQSSFGSLFRKTYKPSGLEGILRPKSHMYNSHFQKLYDALYHGHARDGLSTGQVVMTLRILLDTVQCESVTLIGSHDGGGGGTGEELQPLPREVQGSIAAEIAESIGQDGNGAGCSVELLNLLKEALKSKVSIKTSLLMGYTTKQKIDKFIKVDKRPHSTISPIPIHPSKRDLILLAADVWTGYFHNQVMHPHTDPFGLAIYLDVSGSVNQHLPKILGVLQHLRDSIKTVYQFSNAVAETSFDSLVEGRIKTTHGTDFDCVADSIVGHGYDKAVVITDGYASMDDERKKQLNKMSTKLLTILYGSGTHCSDLAEFGDVVKMSDVSV